MRRADDFRADAPVFAGPSIRLRSDDVAVDGFTALFRVGGVRLVVADVVVVAFFAVAAGLAEARDATPRVFFAAAFFTGDDFLAVVPRADAAGRSTVLDVARLPAVEPGFTVLDALAAPPFLAGVFFATRVDDAAFFDEPRFAGVDLADAAGFFVTVFFAGDRLLAAALGVTAFLATVFFAVFVAAVLFAAFLFAAVFFTAVLLAPLVLPAAARPDVFLPGVPVVLTMHGLLVARFDRRNRRLEPGRRAHVRFASANADAIIERSWSQPLDDPDRVCPRVSPRPRKTTAG